jgi:hypothetical protein
MLTLAAKCLCATCAWSAVCVHPGVDPDHPESAVRRITARLDLTEPQSDPYSHRHVRAVRPGASIRSWAVLPIGRSGSVSHRGDTPTRPIAGALGDSPKPTAPTPGTDTSGAGERVEGNSGGCCYVQRVDPVRHRDGDHHVGRCQGHIRQARPLCTEEQGHTDGVI